MLGQDGEDYIQPRQWSDVHGPQRPVALPSEMLFLVHSLGHSEGSIREQILLGDCIHIPPLFWDKLKDYQIILGIGWSCCCWPGAGFH